MLVPYTLDLECLSFEGVAELDRRNIVQRFTNQYLFYGIFLYPEKLGLEGIHEIICDKFPGKYRNLIREFLARSRKAALPYDHMCIQNAKTCADLDELIHDIEIHCCDSKKAENIYGIPEGEFSVMYQGAEILRFEYPDQSEKFADIKKAIETGIEKGESRIDAWNRYFYHVAKFSKNIFIVDRYALSQTDTKGLAFFLKRIQEVGGSTKKVTILSSYGHEEKPYKGRGERRKVGSADVQQRMEDVIESLDVAGSTNNIEAVTLWCCPERDFKQFAHSRYFVFDNRGVISNNDGVGSFGCELVYRDSEVTFRQYEEKDRNIMRGLMKNGFLINLDL